MSRRASALAATQEGDTILVAPGTCTGPDNRELDFGGIDRVLVAPAGPRATVIDCEEEHVRALIFQEGETAATQVGGFTITSARSSENDGGAILALGSSSLQLHGRVLEGNEANPGRGGAIY
jgi:hypothetical protein